MSVGIPADPRAPACELPPVIVLSQAATGLALVRALARAGARVHAVAFEPGDPVRWSRYGQGLRYAGDPADEAPLVEFLRELALRVGGRPVVLPSSDGHALMLARHAAELAAACRLFTTSAQDLETLVRKDRLYALARSAGVPVVPGIAAAGIEEIARWSLEHPGPYLVKPAYVGVADCALPGKNCVLPDRPALLAGLARWGARELVVQRLCQGGDGAIYDVYGYCDAAGRVRTLASHRRIRQCAPNLGATSYGWIPSGLGAGDERIFEATQRLLGATRLHGIFGIEWLLERETGVFRLIDCNARPFLSIGHLVDAGLDLPTLAWHELAGRSLEDLPMRPALRPLAWIDLVRDLSTQITGTSAEHRRWGAWLLEVLRARSHAYWDWRDPGPALARAAEALALVRRGLRRRAHPAAPVGTQAVPAALTRR